MDSIKMTAQQIAANMTKGEWICSTNSPFVYCEGKWIVESVSLPAGVQDEIMANAQAIVTAVNATYGAGIDPEQIGFVIKALKEAKDVIGYLENKFYGHEGSSVTYNSIQDIDRTLSSLYITKQDTEK